MGCEGACEENPHDGVGGYVETEESGAEEDGEDIWVDEGKVVAERGRE